MIIQKMKYNKKLEGFNKIMSITFIMIRLSKPFTSLDALTFSLLLDLEKFN